jgi:hypothetical protein
MFVIAGLWPTEVGGVAWKQASVFTKITVYYSVPLSCLLKPLLDGGNHAFVKPKMFGHHEIMIRIA